MQISTLWYVDLRGLWVILSPDLLKLVQVVGAQDRPVTCQVVKIVHNDCYKQVDDL